MTTAEAAESTALLLRDGVIILGAAMVSVMVFRRLGLGAVLAYLVAGILVGPYVLGLVGDAEAILRVSEIGIVLLLFLVGLELHPDRLWRLRGDIFGLGLLQLLLSGAALAALVAFAGGFSWPAAIAIGFPLALSSTAQVLPGLKSDGSIHSRTGERAFSVLLLQDLSIVPLIVLIAALSRAPADPTSPPGWMLTLYTIGAIVGMVAAGRFLINPLFRLVGRISERELFIVAGLFIVLASAAIMESLSLSPALGAFIAGVMLADSPYRHELEADIDPFRSILLGFFFIAVGMMLDLDAIAAQPGFVLAMAAALIAIKTLVLAGIAGVFGITRRDAVKLGLLLSQGGEFAFVLFAAGAAALLIDPAAASLFGAIVTLSMASTPMLMRFNLWLDERASRRAGESLEGPEQSPSTAAIVVGYGRFGQTVAQMLLARGIVVTLIDSKPSQIEMSGDFGAKVYYGDGTRVDLLRIAGGGEAQAILLCIDEPLPARRLDPLLHAFPQAAFLVRAFDRRHLIDLREHDLAFVVREVFESAVKMGCAALHLFGADEKEIDGIEEEYRRTDSERLDFQAATGDLHALKEMLHRPQAEGGSVPKGAG